MNHGSAQLSFASSSRRITLPSQCTYADTEAMPGKSKKELEPIELVAAKKYSDELQGWIESGNCILSIRLLLECLQSTDSIKHATLIKQIGQNIKKFQPEGQEQITLCCKILVDIFLELPLKSIVKKTVSSVLQNSPESIHGFISEYLTSMLMENLKNISDITNANTVRSMIENIIACFDNFQLGEDSISAAVVNVLQFLGHVLILMKQQLRDTRSPLEITAHYHNLEVSVRGIVLTMQKSNPALQKLLASGQRDLLLEILVQILHNVLTFLNDDHILLDCRMHCGMAVPLLVKQIFGPNYCTMIMQIAYPKSAKIDNESIMCNIQNQLEGFPADLDFTLSLLGALPFASQLYLTNGLLSIMEINDLSKEVLSGQLMLTDVFLPDLLRISANNKDSAVMISCCKGLLLWTHRALHVLQNCAKENKSFLETKLGSEYVSEQLMDFLWSHWEHFIEGIRHLARSIFINFIKIHCLSKGQLIKKSPFVENLVEQLLTMPAHRCSKYSALCCMVELVGSQYILECQPSLPHDLLAAMEDKLIACHASELFEKLFTYHLNQIRDSMPVWQQLWVSPVLTALCQDSKVLELEIILSKLLKCCPESLQFITSISSDEEDYPTSVKYLGALIKALKTAKVLGILNPDTKNSSQYWNSVLAFSALNHALRHATEEIRLDAFGLLCLSSKSTEMLALVDLELIGSFISENLSSQSPSFRQQLLAYIKKLILRIRDGGYACQKKINNLHRKGATDADEEIQRLQSTLKYYQEFLHWLADLQFSSLHVGANFPRRGTALQILVLLHDFIGFHTVPETQIFSLANNLTFFNIQTLLECLRDTYEVNKGLALHILKDIFTDVIGFQNEQRLLALFEAGLALASSPRPAESTTAAYLIRLLVHFPGTWSVATATKQLFEEGCRASQEGSGRATPVLDFKDGDSTNLQELMPEFELAEKHTTEDTVLIVLEVLLMQLQGEMECAKYSLLEAALHAPMHGLLLCIRSLLSEVDLRLVANHEQWQNVIGNIVEVTFTLSELVQPIVNNASPEGHMPMDTDHESLLQLYGYVQKALGRDPIAGGADVKSNPGVEGDDLTLADYSSNDVAKLHAITAQMLLLCGWRTMKEVSLTLGELCERSALPVNNDAEGSLLSWKQIQAIGEYFTTQLGEIKHRGAFEQAYAGFCKMCSSLWNSPGKLHELPRQWLLDLFSQFQNGVVSAKYCSTRRSAGIPFMVQALVSTEPPVNNYSSLNEVMRILLDVCLNLPHGETDTQVHALNILRALFRDMRLGESVAPYIAQGMKAAIIGFRSNIWAICNSSTLLFSALITRIFGVKRGKDERNRKNCMTGRVFFQRFPSLYEFLLEELAVATRMWKNSQDEYAPKLQKLPLHPSLYPILLLLSRLYPSALEGSDSNLKLSAFVPYIKLCSYSPNVKNRTLAAQALVPLILVNSFHIMIEEIISELPNKSDRFSQNHLHGLLLLVLQFLAEINSVPENLRSNISDNLGNLLESKQWILSRNNPCLVTRTTFLEIIDAAICQNLIEPDHMLINATQVILLQEVYEYTENPGCPGDANFHMIVAKLALNIAIMTTEISGSAEVKWSSSELCELSNAVGGNDFTSHALTPHDPMDANWSFADHIPDEQENRSLIIEIVSQLLHSQLGEVRLLVMRWLYLLLQQETFNDTGLTRDEITVPITFSSFHWAYNSRKTQCCIQQLLSSKTVVLTLISLALSEEEGAECLTELFHLLCLFPFAIHLPWPHPSDLNKPINSFEKLDILLQRGEAEFRDDLRCALLRFTGSLVPQVYLDVAESPDDEDSQNKTILEEWADAFLLCCSSEQSLSTRRTAAHVLTHVASYFLLDPHHILESTSCMMWCALVRLLLDDDFEIKKTAASVVNIFDSFSRFSDSSLVTHDIQHVVALDLTIGYFVDNYGEKFQTECLTTLLDWCLREEVTEAFSTSEEEERLFDKGEMNIYTEEVTLTNVVIKHLKRLLRRLFGGTKFDNEGAFQTRSGNTQFNIDLPGFQQIDYNNDNVTEKFIPESLTSDSLAVLSMPVKEKDAVMSNLTIPTDQVTSWLPSAETASSQSESDFFILRDIVTMVAEELNILLSEMPTGTNKTPFMCRHFDQYMLRLYRQIMVLTSLSKYDSSQAEMITSIESVMSDKITSTSPHFNRLTYIMMREIKKAVCILSQTQCSDETEA